MTHAEEQDIFRADHPDTLADIAVIGSAFDLARPEVQTLPLVFDSPHSGAIYPPRLLAMSKLDAGVIRRSEDSFVDQLFAGVVARGAPLLSARFPRAYLDANREPFELDPGMFSEALPAYANSKSPRVVSGLGTIARVVADGSEIYREKLEVMDALTRIERLYKPYHRQLTALLQATQAKFGFAILVNCHSMPSLGTVSDAQVPNRPDFVLGDRHGTACAPLVIATAERFLTERGYHVARNTPYAGAYAAEHYGRPAHAVHALQIEVNRSLYMDEARFEPTSGLDIIAADMAALASVLGLIDLGRLAAE